MSRARPRTDAPPPFGRSLRVAFGFLTTLPVALPDDWRDDELEHAVRAYPWVGLGLGLVLAAAALLLAGAGQPLRSVLLVALWFALTGGLHFDGLVDIADAALGARTPAERRRIAGDPRVGAFGLLAGILLVLVKVSALMTLEEGPLLAGLLLAPLLTRSATPACLAAWPVHDASRLGRSSRLDARAAVGPLLVGLLLAAAVGAASLSVWIFTVTVVMLAGWSAWLGGWIDRRFAGLGGDAYGALIESGEAVVLVALGLIARGL